MGNIINCIQILYTIFMKVFVVKEVNCMKNRTESTSSKMSAKEFAYQQLKKRIIEGKLYPDQPIVEEDLSSKLEISRTPLREALQSLEIEKLVVRKPNGRLKVAPISVKEVKEIFNVRSKLEEIVTLEATENAAEKDIQNLLKIVDMIKRAYRNGNLEDILVYGAEFHSYIYNLSGNNTVNYILFQLNDHIHRYRRLVPNQHKDLYTEEKEEHEVILEYIAKKDGAGAAQAMKSHIENSLTTAIIAIETYQKNTVW